MGSNNEFTIPMDLADEQYHRMLRESQFVSSFPGNDTLMDEADQVSSREDFGSELYQDLYRHLKSKTTDYQANRIANIVRMCIELTKLDQYHSKAHSLFYFLTEDARKLSSHIEGYK